MPTRVDTPSMTDDIRHLLPHAGAMILIDRVLAHTETEITCSADNHRDLDHPLRHDGTLDSAVLIEYAAQATAIHGTLATIPGTPRIAFLAAARKLTLARVRLDTLHQPLIIHARRLLASADGVIYNATVRHVDTTLLDGRLTVMFPATTAQPTEHA